MTDEKLLPYQHYINEAEFEEIERAARGYQFPPNMKGYAYMFCVFVFFKRKMERLEKRLQILEREEIS